MRPAGARAGYWNVNAGWGVYFNVTHIPLSKSTRKTVRNNLTKALFMTVWCPDSRSVESNCGIPRG